jgi:hypothetical protein
MIIMKMKIWIKQILEYKQTYNQIIYRKQEKMKDWQLFKCQVNWMNKLSKEKSKLIFKLITANLIQKKWTHLQENPSS